MTLFPFTAVVGQQKLKDALLINAVNPAVSGVLIRGEKGTAKSTLARALAELLPPITVVPGCPYQCEPDAPFAGCPHCQPLLQQGRLSRQERRMRVVTLPVNASEDRVCGTLDLEKALQTGQRHFEPGILAEVHRGILYIDEVNLLDDHIVDVLLDAAAMRVNTVEREGVRMTHPSHFLLIGTMNPEEGELRPQLLDRFGLCVNVEAILDVDARAEIVLRRLAWERDPEGFVADYTEAQRALARRAARARALLDQVHVTDAQVRQIAGLCVQLDIRSHRADIVIAQTAATFAALDERTEILAEDMQRAAELALPHRTRRRPFEEQQLDTDQVAEALTSSQPEPQVRQADMPMPESHDDAPPPTPSDVETPRQEKVFDIGERVAVALPELDMVRQRRNGDGRAVRSPGETRRGRYVRSALPAEPVVASSDVAVGATLRAAAPYQTMRQGSSSRASLRVRSSDVRVKVRETTSGTLVLLVVDASGSMGAAERMSAAKGAVLSLLEDAYVRRDKVGLIAFRDKGADVILQPTDSVEQAHERLSALPTGGKTPLAHGVMAALRLAQQVRRRDPTMLCLAVLLSDGKANVPYDEMDAGRLREAQSPYDHAVAAARRLKQEDVHLLVLDTEDDFLTLGLARELAERVGADYVKLASLEAATITQAIRYDPA